MISSYLSIITNTPENSKEMIRNRLFHTLRKGSILESSQAIANISRKQSFDLSTIHKRHNSMSSQSLMSSLNKHASNGSPSVYNNILNLKVNKVKTVIKQPKFEIIPFNLRSMEQYLNKVRKDPIDSLDKGIQTGPDVELQPEIIPDESNIYTAGIVNNLSSKKRFGGAKSKLTKLASSNLSSFEGELKSTSEYLNSQFANSIQYQNQSKIKLIAKHSKLYENQKLINHIEERRKRRNKTLCDIKINKEFNRQIDLKSTSLGVGNDAPSSDTDMSRNLHSSILIKKGRDVDSKRKIHNFMTNMHLDYYKSLNPNYQIYSSKGNSHQKGIHKRVKTSKLSSSSRKRIAKNNVILKGLKVSTMQMKTQEITENVSEVHEAPKPPVIIEPKRKNLINKVQNQDYDHPIIHKEEHGHHRNNSKNDGIYYDRNYKVQYQRTSNDFAYQSDDLREDPLKNLFINMSQTEKDELFKDMDDIDRNDIIRSDEFY